MTPCASAAIALMAADAAVVGIGAEISTGTAADAGLARRTADAIITWRAGAGIATATAVIRVALLIDASSIAAIQASIAGKAALALSAGWGTISHQGTDMSAATAVIDVGLLIDASHVAVG